MLEEYCKREMENAYNISDTEPEGKRYSEGLCVSKDITVTGCGGLWGF
jgi:hypothetical protein